MKILFDSLSLDGDRGRELPASKLSTGGPVEGSSCGSHSSSQCLLKAFL